MLKAEFHRLLVARAVHAASGRTQAKPPPERHHLRPNLLSKKRRSPQVSQLPKPHPSTQRSILQRPRHPRRRQWVNSFMRTPQGRCESHPRRFRTPCDRAASRVATSVAGAHQHASNAAVVTVRPASTVVIGASLCRPEPNRYRFATISTHTRTQTAPPPSKRWTITRSTDGTRMASLRAFNSRAVRWLTRMEVCFTIKPCVYVRCICMHRYTYCIQTTIPQ